MDRLVQVLLSIFLGVSADVLDGVAFEKRDLVLEDEHARLDFQTLVMTPANLSIEWIRHALLVATSFAMSRFDTGIFCCYFKQVNTYWIITGIKDGAFCSIPVCGEKRVYDHTSAQRFAVSILRMSQVKVYSRKIEHENHD